MVCLFYLLKEPDFSFVDLFCSPFVSLSFISALIFKMSFILLTLEFLISSFSSCFRCRVRLFIWHFFVVVSWGMPVLLWIFPLALLLQCPSGFWVVVFSSSFLSMHILISFLIYSVICWLFSSVLFSLHMLDFLIVFLL